MLEIQGSVNDGWSKNRRRYVNFTMEVSKSQGPTYVLINVQPLGLEI